MKMLTSFEQGSPEWKQARAGKVTASRAKDARDKLKSGAASGKQIAYACQVALERVSHQPADATLRELADARRAHSGTNRTRRLRASHRQSCGRGRGLRH